MRQPKYAHIGTIVATNRVHTHGIPLQIHLNFQLRSQVAQLTRLQPALVNTVLQTKAKSLANASHAVKTLGIGNVITNDVEHGVRSLIFTAKQSTCLLQPSRPHCLRLIFCLHGGRSRKAQTRGHSLAGFQAQRTARSTIAAGSPV